MRNAMGLHIKETVLQTELFPPKFLCHSPNPIVVVFGDMIRVEWGHKGGVLMMGLVSLEEETPETLFPPSLSTTKDRARREPSASQEESSPEKWIAATLILECPASRSPGVIFCYGSLSWLYRLASHLLGRHHISSRDCWFAVKLTWPKEKYNNNGKKHQILFPVFDSAKLWIKAVLCKGTQIIRPGGLSHSWRDLRG